MTNMRINEDNIKKKFLENFWVESLYIVINLIFLLFLWHLNKELLSKFSSSEYFKIVTYQNGKPMIFFAMTVLSIISGVIIIMTRFKKIRYEDPDITEIIYFLLSAFIISVIILILIIAINNPILQAIIAFICGTAIIIYANN